MKPSSYLISIIIAGMLFSGVMVMFEQVGTHKFGDKYASFNNTYGSIQSNVLSETDQYSGKLQQNDPSVGQGDFSFLNFLLAGSWEVVKLILNPFEFVYIAFAELGNLFGIGFANGIGWLASGIMAIITVGIVFSAISAFTRGGNL